MLRRRPRLSTSPACPGPPQLLQLWASPLQRSKQWQLRKRLQPGWQAASLAVPMVPPLHLGAGLFMVQCRRPATATHHDSMAEAAAAAVQ
jgi:hypothetical protein